MVDAKIEFSVILMVVLAIFLGPILLIEFSKMLGEIIAEIVMWNERRQEKRKKQD